VAFNKICEFQPFLWNMDLSSSLIWYAANQFNQSSQSSVAKLSGYNQGTISVNHSCHPRFQSSLSS
jgi:hypothetical protein